jgi:hypothetical protein
MDIATVFDCGKKYSKSEKYESIASFYTCPEKTSHWELASKKLKHLEFES